MAFKNDNLGVIAFANGFTMWQYKSDDAIAEITQEGYFDPIYTLCDRGDIFVINAVDTTKMMCVHSVKPMILIELGGKYDEDN